MDVRYIPDSSEDMQSQVQIDNWELSKELEMFRAKGRTYTENG